MSKLAVFCCALFTVLIHGNGYEFDDVAFNQILASEFEDISNAAFAPMRVRRDDNADEKSGPRCHPPPPLWRRQQLCCAEDLVEKMHKEHGDLKRECLKELTAKGKIERAASQQPSDVDPLSCEDMHRRKDQMKCVYQCVGQKLNLLDADGNMKEDVISKYIKEQISTAKFPEDVQNKIIDTCIKEAKNMTRNTDQSEATCNPVPLKLVHCVFRELQLNCPEDQIKDKESCKKFQDKLRNGFGFHHRSPPPPGRPFRSDSSEEER